MKRRKETNSRPEYETDRENDPANSFTRNTRYTRARTRLSAKGETGAKEAKRGRGITCGGYRRVPTAVFTVKASTHIHTAATTRLSVGTSHRLVHFYSLPLFFHVRSLLITRVLPFSLLRLGISCPSRSPRGGRHPKNRAVRGAAGFYYGQFLLRPALPKFSKRNGRYTVRPTLVHENICAIARDNDTSYHRMKR